MPNKLTLQEIEQRLPKFVKIVPESYKGIRYNADFIDTEYNEKFNANVHCLIKLQHGCRTRSNFKRSLTQKGKKKTGMTAEEVAARIPSYLEIDFNSYKGAKYKTRFYDKEYKVWFEAYPFNVMRDQTGYCKERYRDTTFKKFKLTIEEVKERLFKLYNNQIQIVDSTYIDTNHAAQFIINGRTAKYATSTMLSGRFFNRKLLEKWKSYVMVRDRFLCQKCENEGTHAHHVLSPKKFPEHLSNIHLGICLCGTCHRDYHAKYKNEETIDNFCSFLQNEVLANILKERALLAIFNP